MTADLDGVELADGGLRDSARACCPVHQDGKPPTLPLGVPFADRVTVQQIDRRTAHSIYQAHHSYISGLERDHIVANHGIYLDDHLVGAVSWGPPLMRSLNGLSASHITEAARVCLAVDQPNLASCGFRKSQKRFLSRNQRRYGVQLFVSYVRDDFTGSMFRALRGLGWRLDDVVEGHQAGNRPEREIREVKKQRWVCPVEDDSPDQSALKDFSKVECGQP